MGHFVTGGLPAFMDAAAGGGDRGGRGTEQEKEGEEAREHH